MVQRREQDASTSSARQTFVDFVRLVGPAGFPPRVVALHNAQVPVQLLAELLLARLPQLEAFLGEQTAANMLQLRMP